MKKGIFLLGLVGLIILGVPNCSKNKFKLTRSEPTANSLANDTCFVCHNVSTLQKTVGTESVTLYVNREKFALSPHRAKRCVECHTDIVWDNVKKEHNLVLKYYGGWANFSLEDSTDSNYSLQTRNYYTKASLSCVNCHGRSSFLSSPHYLIGGIKNSHLERYGNVEIGKEYNEAKCGKCHLTCATCHFKGEIVQSKTGEVTTIWGELLNGNQIEDGDSLTNRAIDWTKNVEAHDFRSEEDFEGSDDLCGACHTGFYTNYNKTGYYHPDGLPYFDFLVSQGVEKYPQSEERRLVKGDIMVVTGIPTLDSLYEGVGDRGAMRDYKCIYCHDRIHSLTPISCRKIGCHDDKDSTSFNDFGYPFTPHLDVACVACHDATVSPWRDPYSGDTVKAAVVRDNKVISWYSHMLIRPNGENTNFCDRRCHNPVIGPTIGAPWTYHHTGEIHD